VIVKHENHTPVGAFKVRGGLVYLDRLVRERPDVSGVISATRGNHGQSLAFAGRAYGRSVTIFVPHGNSVEKNAAMRALGAELVEFGADFQEAREQSLAVAAERGLEAVPPFHPDLVLGVATYALELFEGAGPLDSVYVPIGMGSGINGLIAVRDLLGLDTAIVGVVSDRAPSTLLSFERGEVVTTDTAATFVDGVATRSPDPDAVAGLIGGAARVIAVSDDATAEAMRIVYRTTHNVAESAGAIALAGLLSEPVDRRGERSAFVLSGGNVDATQLHAVLAGRTPTP
jgi:threonine dehydratase